ncbi:MAG: cytochrome c [Nitrospirales bacterium]
MLHYVEKGKDTPYTSHHLCTDVFLYGRHFGTKSMPDSAGEKIYRVHCFRCHGKIGDGRVPDSIKLIVPPGDFHSPESTAKSDIDLRAIIIWGVVFSPMHGWWDRLSSEEIRAVIGYIRQLAPYQPRI